METNVLYYGDNLEILRKYIPDESVDLIYLDPPFNSKATYNVLYKELTGQPSQAQITAFEDTWQWGTESEISLKDIASSNLAPQATKELMFVLPNFVGKKTPMRAYLTMMCIRLVELRRVLKDTGSIYLHCDPTASHYLKIVMDTIFDVKNFRNEIIWHYQEHGTRKKHSLAKGHETILYYSKGVSPTWNVPLKPYSERLIQSLKKDDKGWYYTRGQRTGRRAIAEWEKEAKIGLKTYVDLEHGGTAFDTVWDWQDVGSYPKTGESLGYETQKPLTLLERIVQASSNEGDIVLDPFCGCGTALVASHKLNRKWIGIDVTHLAISTMKWRLEKTFHISADKDYKVIGEPKDLESAKELSSQNKYQFQWWAVSLIGGQPYGDKKKGADTGIDGYLYFMDEKDKIKKGIISVKSGNVSVSQVRDLVGVVKREKAEMGVFLTLEPITKPMEQEAVLEGFYHSPLVKGYREDYRKIQILTIADLLTGKKPEIPSWISPIATPASINKTKGKTAKLL